MRIPPALAVSVVLLWALGYPIGALGVASMSPFLLLFLRFAISGALLAGAARATGRRLPSGGALRHSVAAGLLAQATQFLGCYLGLRAGVPAGVAALILGVNPTVTALLARAVLREPLTPRKAGAAALGLGAVVAACWSTVPQLAHAGAGIGFTLLGLAGLAAGGLYQQRFCRDVDPVAGNAVGMIASAVPAGLLTLTFGAAVVDPVRGAVVLVVMVLFNAILASTLYLRVIALAGASGAAMLFAVIPAAAAVFSYALLNEPVHGGVVIGLILGSAACLVAAVRGRRAPDQEGRTGPAWAGDVRSGASR